MPCAQIGHQFRYDKRVRFCSAISVALVVEVVIVLVLCVFRGVRVVVPRRSFLEGIRSFLDGEPCSTFPLERLRCDTSPKLLLEIVVLKGLSVLMGGCPFR